MRPWARASSVISVSSRSNAICWPRVSTPRSNASVPIATAQPLPGSPTHSEAGVRAPSKNTSLNSAVPVIWRIGRISMPGWSIATSRYDNPWWRWEPTSVRATTKHQSDHCASDVQTFWPSMTHSSPSRRARVETFARSEPALGSE